MGKDNLDKVIKDKLYNLSTPIDTNDLWSNIESKMDNEQPKSNPVFPFAKFLGFGMLAILLTGTTYFAYNFMIDSEVETNAISNVDIDSPQQDLTSVNSVTTSESPIAKNSSQLTKNTKNSQVKNNTNTNPQTNNLKNNSVNVTSYSDAKRETKNDITDDHTANQNRKLTNKATKTISESRSQNESNNSQRTSESSPSNIASDSSNDIYGSVKETKADYTKSNGSAIDNDIFQKQYGADSQRSLIDRINRLDKRQNAGVSFNNKLVDVCSYKDKIDCYDAWTKDNKLSIIPYVGVDFVTNDRIRTDTFASYLQNRENSMRFLEVIKAGLLVKYNITPNLYVKAGIEYDQIREVFQSTIQDINQIATDGIIAYQVSAEGDTTAIQGTVFSTEITTTEWRKYNKYHSYNVPLIVGLQAPIANANGWAYFMEGGIFYNLRFTYEGSLLDQNNNVVSGENYYLNSTGVSLYTGVGISYNFNKKLAAFATGSYKYNLEPINNADYNPIKQNLGLAGVAVGLEIRIGNN